MVYGSNGRVFNARACTFVAATLPLQSVSCVTSPGVGHDLRWRAEVYEQASESFVVPADDASLSVSSDESACRYTPPNILSVVSTVSLLSTRGGQTVRLLGTDFGASGLDTFHNLTVRR